MPLDKEIEINQIWKKKPPPKTRQKQNKQKQNKQTNKQTNKKT